MRETRTMAIAVAGLWLALTGAAAAKSAAGPRPPSQTVVEMAAWASDTGDNHGLPFVIVDKLAAEVFVYDADGQMLGAAPALLGFARGDQSTPGVGDRELSDIRPADRTTPAGRFMSGFGAGGASHKVFWVDYGTAISLHAVIKGTPKEHRAQRLRSATPKDNRITFGCINVPTAFYQHVVLPTFKGSNAVVYILPEKRPIEEVFPSFRLATQASATPDPAGLQTVSDSSAAGGH